MAIATETGYGVMDIGARQSTLQGAPQSACPPEVELPAREIPSAEADDCRKAPVACRPASHFEPAVL